MTRKEINQNVAHAIYFSTGQRPQGRKHKVKTEEKKRLHKAHQKKLKAKRLAKKGIYANKITYPKKRGN